MNAHIGLIPEEFLLLRKEYLTVLLRKLPVIKAGRRGDKEVFRIYSEDRQHYKEVTHKNREWNKYVELHNKRSRVEMSLKHTEDLYKHVSKHQNRNCTVKTNTDNNLNSSYFDSLIDCSCSINKTKDYNYNGRNYRSRAEMQFATILDEFGLEFKYDVQIKYGNHECTVDFVIVFREFNRCIFIEYFGRCDDPEYNDDNMSKLWHAQNNKVYIGRDIFIISGDINYTPGTDVMRILLASIIAQLSAIYIVEK